MGYNVLSGSVSSIFGFLGSGSFTGSFGGDGTDLINVKQFDLYGDYATGKLAVYKTVNSKTHLQGDSNLYYDTTNDILTVSKLTASSDITITSGDLYTDQIRRSSDSSTTTKINLDDEVLKLYAGHASNEVVKVESGKLTVTGNITGSGGIEIGTYLSASGQIHFPNIASGSIAGNGSFLGLSSAGNLVLTSSIGGGGTVTISNDANNRITTADGSGGIVGEANLTFDGSILTLAGNMTGSGGLKIGTYLSASGQIHFPNISSGSIAGNGSFIGLNTAGNLVLTSSLGGGTVSITNDGDNRITTANGSGGIVGEANLTFDGNKLSLQGGLVLKRRQISSVTTASVTDYFIGISASANLDVRLPDASTLTSGQTFIFKDERGSANSHVIKINASGSQTIDGQSFVRLESPYAAINVYTDGISKYFIF